MRGCVVGWLGGGRVRGVLVSVFVGGWVRVCVRRCNASMRY